MNASSPDERDQSAVIAELRRLGRELHEVQEQLNRIEAEKEHVLDGMRHAGPGPTC
jgi:hypothetical protein